MSANRIFDAIEDEFIKHLESTPDSLLPRRFAITIPAIAFMAMLQEGMIDQAGTRLGPEHHAVSLSIAGHELVVMEGV